MGRRLVGRASNRPISYVDGRASVVCRPLATKPPLSITPPRHHCHHPHRHGYPYPHPLPLPLVCTTAAIAGYYVVLATFGYQLFPLLSPKQPLPANHRYVSPVLGQLPLALWVVHTPINKCYRHGALPVLQCTILV